MEEGFVMDMSHGYRGVSHWISGAPEPSLWSGVKTKDKLDLPVRTFRCSKCGFLESYA